eukprot:m.174560 g.174560  ORF g.174560 m.174560 type:complete len:295 (-) comp14594_c0_seq1:7324-8208(-)
MAGHHKIAHVATTVNDAAAPFDACPTVGSILTVDMCFEGTTTTLSWQLGIDTTLPSVEGIDPTSFEVACVLADLEFEHKTKPCSVEFQLDFTRTTTAETDKQPKPLILSLKSHETSLLRALFPGDTHRLHAQTLKARGLRLFQLGHLEAATSYFGMALQSLLLLQYLQREELGDLQELQLACYANLSACHLKRLARVLKSADSSEKRKGVRFLASCAKDAAMKVLEISPTHPKALLRIATAHRHLKDFEEALTYLSQLLERDATNSAALKEKQLVLQLRRKENEKAKKAFAKLW